MGVREIELGEERERVAGRERVFWVDESWVEERELGKRELEWMERTMG